MCILIYMPTKNVYVADSDLELFDTAAEFAGGMSPAVVAGLRLYVAQQQKSKEATQMRQIEIEVQDGAVITTKRFTGRQLLRYQQQADGRLITYRVYATARDQIAVHVRNDPDWASLSTGRDDDAQEASRWDGQWWQRTERSLHVFPSVDALGAALPEDVTEAIRRSLSEPAVEELDI